MAVCFGANFNSDALSSDILAPPGSQAWSSQAMSSRIQVFTTISDKKLQGQIGQSQICLQNKVFKKPQLCILLEGDFEDDLSDYTPQPGPAKKKSIFRQPINITCERPWMALHEFMKPSKVNWRNGSRAKHLLESHSLFFEKISEQESLDAIYPRFFNPLFGARICSRRVFCQTKRAQFIG